MTKLSVDTVGKVQCKIVQQLPSPYMGLISEFGNLAQRDTFKILLNFLHVLMASVRNVQKLSHKVDAIVIYATIS